MYKGKPLVRSGNTLYYGNMTDSVVVMMQIQSTKKVNDIDVADKVTVQLMKTDPTLRARERIVKKSEKDGLYNAMDIGSIWLERALANEKKLNNKSAHRNASAFGGFCFDMFYFFKAVFSSSSSLLKFIRSSSITNGRFITRTFIFKMYSPSMPMKKS